MTSFNTKYEVLYKIGEGSFSEVLKVKNKATEEYCAAKRLKKIFKSHECVLNSAEVVASQKISYHPNVLNLLEYFYDTMTGKAVLIFELMDMSLYDYLKRKSRRLTEQTVKKFLYQILRGLNHLHINGLFHRDIKPENILIRTSLPNNVPVQGALIKLADLGSVRGIFSDPPYTEYISTRWYRSPECLLTIGNYGPRMDIWATGCVFYEMLTLKPLFSGANEIDQLHKIHEILGTPSGTLFVKLKRRSKNFTTFPQVPGCGLDCRVSFLSEPGRKILKLMLEYDAEKRTNARRLLQNYYFNDLRQAKARSLADRLSSSRASSIKEKTTKRDDSVKSNRENTNPIRKASATTTSSKSPNSRIICADKKDIRKSEDKSRDNKSKGDWSSMHSNTTSVLDKMLKEKERKAKSKEHERDSLQCSKTYTNMLNTYHTKQPPNPFVRKPRVKSTVNDAISSAPPRNAEMFKKTTMSSSVKPQAKSINLLPNTIGLTDKYRKTTSYLNDFVLSKEPKKVKNQLKSQSFVVKRKIKSGDSQATPDVTQKIQRKKEKQ